MLLCKTRRGRLVYYRRAYAANFICRDAHSDTRAANKNTLVRFARRNAFRNGKGDIGIIALFAFAAAEVIYFYAALL